MKTLILNIDGTPLSVVTKRRAIKLVLNCKNVSPLCFYDEYVKSENDAIKIPAVLLYNRYIKINRMGIYPSKKMIYNRDMYLCQYCGTQLLNSNATIDHIIPVSRFSSKKEANTWENMVACCKKCNTKKSNRTIQEVNMNLIKVPKAETSRLLFMGKIPPEWKDYL
jgi:5-methylcytosine-specific restriction endonuclease McrA